MRLAISCIAGRMPMPSISMSTAGAPGAAYSKAGATPSPVAIPMRVAAMPHSTRRGYHRVVPSGRWIEEDLYWCGSAPPAGTDWTAEDWVELPHEAYIPISKARLNQALLDHPRGRAAGSRLEHLLRLVEGLYHFHHHETLNQLKQDYEIFSPDAEEGMRAGVGEEALAGRERRFIGNFMKSTILGNFTAMSDADYRRAVAQSYLLDVPVEIDWRR